MRMQDLEINVEGRLLVDIMELADSCVIIMSQGKAKVAELPAFAETKIVTHQGQVKRVRWEEGEEF
ncbi:MULTISPECIES: XtrA/YqaO family protein [Solibacillus]|uniref:XtrA/YqaO family protein n=1 Tax=Solibacillus merdavium TaxID=2762218 RepID=A0ABR8XJ63_9BACL|nr:XtrA/YqaO family protein [Solibacillus merdavium]MBD8031962.1 XtrA/YqaO family protein [Solibacillus merdavium]